MVLATEEVAAADRFGFVRLVTDAVRDGLAEGDVLSEVTALAGAPRLPRIELAFRRFELADPAGASTDDAIEDGSLVIDCAVVSAEDTVVFTGRLRAGVTRVGFRQSAERAGRTIAAVVTER